MKQPEKSSHYYITLKTIFTKKSSNELSIKSVILANLHR